MKELDELAPDFSFVAAKGLTASHYEIWPESFGNALMVVKSSRIALRFTRDRGTLAVEVGGAGPKWSLSSFFTKKPEPWIHLPYLIRFVDPASKVVPSDYLSLPEQARWLHANWCKVVNLIADEKQVSALEVFQDTQANALLKKIFGDF